MSDTQRAYALKESYPLDALNGYTLAKGEGETVDVKALLHDGGGTLVTDDSQLISELDRSEVLKRVAVPEKTTKRAAKAADKEA